MANLNLVFRSGMSRLNDFHGAADACVPLGVVVGELSTNLLLMGIPRYLDKGGSVFVDSGAFSAFISGESMDWTSILQRYEMLADCTMAPENLYLVAPDRVGDQQATLQLLREWKTQLTSLLQKGIKLIVPIQCGAMPAQDMLEKVSAILGTADFVAGIPSNRAAMSNEECATLRHHTFHILGQVSNLTKDSSRVDALLNLNPDATVNADANWLRSRLFKVSEMASSERCIRVGVNASTQSLSVQRHHRAAAITKLLASDNWC